MLAILIEKIISLFIVLILGMVLVKTGICKPQDSKVLSKLMVYLITPCIMISAFQIDMSPELSRSLLIVGISTVAVCLLYMLLAILFRKPFRLSQQEMVMLEHPNCGNLPIPIVAALLGGEFVIFSSLVSALHDVTFWMEGNWRLSGDKKFNWKKIFLSVNMLAIMGGIVLMVCGISLPVVIQKTLSDISGMLSCVAMLIIGLMLGGISWKQVVSFKKMWRIIVLRLAVFPVIMILALKLTAPYHLMEDGKNVILPLVIAMSTPPATIITTLSQLYGTEEEYAGVTTVVSTLCCMITLPLIVALYGIV